MTDRFVIRTVAAGLLLIALAVTVGCAILIIFGDLTDEQTTYILGAFTAIGTTAVGAGAALLAKTSSVPDLPPPPPQA